jgi:esterase
MGRHGDDLRTSGCGAARRVRGDGVDLHLRQWRRPGGAPLLLLHSMAAHTHWWDWAAPLLAERHDVAALDFRGHGESDWAPDGTYEFDGYVRDAVSALDALGWSEAMVIGHSLGGYVAALLAAREPARVSALVIADILTGWSEEMSARGRQQAERAASRLSSAAELAARFRFVPPETVAPRERLEHLGVAGARERGPGVWEHAFDRRALAHPPLDPWPFLPAVAAPTLVVRGGDSIVMDGAACARVAATVQRGRCAELPGTYHHLIVEDPAGFVELVDAWSTGQQ